MTQRPMGVIRARDSEKVMNSSGADQAALGMAPLFWSWGLRRAVGQAQAGAVQLERVGGNGIAQQAFVAQYVQGAGIHAPGCRDWRFPQPALLGVVHGGVVQRSSWSALWPCSGYSAMPMEGEMVSGR